MKRFTDFNTKNLTGGAPFANEHFFTTQQEVYKAIARLAGEAAAASNFLSTNNPNCIIEGVEYSGSSGNYSLSAGLVKLGDDVYEFDGASGLSAPTRIEVGSAVDEQKQYEDGANKDFFETRKATLNASASAPFIQIDFDDQISTQRLGHFEKIDDRIQRLGNASGISTSRILGRDSAGTGVIEQLTVAEVQALLDVFTNSMSTNRMLGRISGGAGAIEELTPAQVFAFLGTELDVKADVAQEAWTTLTPGGAGDWVAIGAPYFTQGIRYRKDTLGYVHLEIAIESPTLADYDNLNGSVSAALPAAYRPATQKWFHIASQQPERNYNLTVTAAGDLRLWERAAPGQTAAGDSLVGSFIFPTDI